MLLTGVRYAPEAAHRLLSVTVLTVQGFMCKITDKTKIWDNQGKLVIQATALLPSTPLHWFWFKLIIPTELFTPCRMVILIICGIYALDTVPKMHSAMPINP